MPGETLVFKAHPWVFAVVLAACGGASAPSTTTPSSSAKAAVDGFMQAVADSNLAQMAALWGTTSGPAARTRQPPDYERRITIMQTYLQNESHRVVSDVADGSEGRRALQVEIRRQLCTWIVPFTAIRLTDGSWIVNQVDLAAAGNPARPCMPGGADSTPAPQE